MNQDALRVAAWVEYEMHNWARWCGSGRWPGPLPAQHCASAERRYRAPSDMSAATGCALPPNAARAQIVQRAYDTTMHRLERRIAVAEYVRPEDFGRQYGRVGAARRLQVSLKTYEMALHNACFKVEKAFGG